MKNLINREIRLQLRCCTSLNRIQTNPEIRHGKEQAGAIPLQRALRGAYCHRYFRSKSVDYALSWKKNPPWRWNSGAPCVACSNLVVCICVGWWIKHCSTLYLIQHSPTRGVSTDFQPFQASNVVVFILICLGEQNQCDPAMSIRLPESILNP